jgi:prophage regulatory protein
MPRNRRELGDESRFSAPLIDAGEFALILGCSVKHIRRMADAGRCPPPVRLGGLVRWTRASVDAWIADGCPAIRRVRMGGGR